MSQDTQTPASQEPTAQQLDEHAKSLMDLLGYSPKVETKPEEGAPEVKPEAATPAETPKEAATPPPKTEQPPKKKVSVKTTVEQPAKVDVEDLVNKAVQAATKVKPDTTQPEVVTPTLDIPDDLSEEEREEIEIAEYAEKKDPKRIGVHKQTVDFIKARREHIEKARSNDPEYDPAQDPELRKLAADKSPKITPAEKRRLFVQRETDAAEQRAYERARKELEERVQNTESQLREITERPELAKKIDTLRGTLFEDVADLKDAVDKPEDFPIEAEIATAVKQEVTQMAEEYLAVRKRLKPLDLSNPAQAKINRFIIEQGDLFEKRGGKSLVRDGKQFIHPAKWRSDMSGTHWTFSEDEVLAALRVDAARQAKARIAAENQKIERAVAARTKRTAAVVQNNNTVPNKSDAHDESPRISTAPMVEGQQAKQSEDPTLELLGYTKKS